jgi:Txe/YoeB family toxin of Txe-Axe toxin-antitoxin module
VAVVSTPPVVDPIQPVSASDDLPMVANDDDLIEKEWVDKAKKIIVETKDDPYRREQEVGRLQADYLYKRYGRQLGAPQ